jgi:broad specificity phosphatase PhoE
MKAGLAQPWVRSLGAIWSSTERKAIDGAKILSDATGLPFTTLAALGENDRSATGYLPRPEFEATADLFFAHPTRSIRGWEPAIAAQSRITAALETLLAATPEHLDIAIVAHGGVGALLICALENLPISRAHDQPAHPEHAGQGGNYFAIDRRTRLLRHGWHPFDA